MSKGLIQLRLNQLRSIIKLTLTFGVLLTLGSPTLGRTEVIQNSLPLGKVVSKAAPTASISPDAMGKMFQQAIASAAGDSSKRAGSKFSYKNVKFLMGFLLVLALFLDLKNGVDTIVQSWTETAVYTYLALCIVGHPGAYGPIRPMIMKVYDAVKSKSVAAPTPPAPSAASASSANTEPAIRSLDTDIFNISQAFFDNLGTSLFGDGSASFNSAQASIETSLKNIGSLNLCAKWPDWEKCKVDPIGYDKVETEKQNAEKKDGGFFDISGILDEWGNNVKVASVTLISLSWLPPLLFTIGKFLLGILSFLAFFTYGLQQAIGMIAFKMVAPFIILPGKARSSVLSGVKRLISLSMLTFVFNMIMRVASELMVAISNGAMGIAQSLSGPPGVDVIVFLSFMTTCSVLAVMMMIFATLQQVPALAKNLTELSFESIFDIGNSAGSAFQSLVSMAGGAVMAKATLGVGAVAGKASSMVGGIGDTLAAKRKTLTNPTSNFSGGGSGGDDSPSGPSGGGSGGGGTEKSGSPGEPAQLPQKNGGGGGPGGGGGGSDENDKNDKEKAKKEAEAKRKAANEKRAKAMGAAVQNFLGSGGSLDSVKQLGAAAKDSAGAVKDSVKKTAMGVADIATSGKASEMVEAGKQKVADLKKAARDFGSKALDDIFLRKQKNFQEKNAGEEAVETMGETDSEEGLGEGTSEGQQQQGKSILKEIKDNANLHKGGTVNEWANNREAAKRMGDELGAKRHQAKIDAQRKKEEALADKILSMKNASFDDGQGGRVDLRKELTQANLDEKGGLGNSFAANKVQQHEDNQERFIEAHKELSLSPVGSAEHQGAMQAVGRLHQSGFTASKEVSNLVAKSNTASASDKQDALLKLQGIGSTVAKRTLNSELSALEPQRREVDTLGTTVSTSNSSGEPVERAEIFEVYEEKKKELHAAEAKIKEKQEEIESSRQIALLKRMGLNDQEIAAKRAAFAKEEEEQTQGAGESQARRPQETEKNEPPRAEGLRKAQEKAMWGNYEKEQDKAQELEIKDLKRREKAAELAKLKEKARRGEI